MRAVMVLFLLPGCDLIDPVPLPDDTDPAEESCPNGTMTPTTNEVVVRNFTWAGGSRTLGWTDDAQVAGNNPACIGISESRGTWRLIADGAYFGTLSFNVAAPGSFVDPNAANPTLTIDGEDVTPTGAIGPGSWSAGNVTVTDDGTTLRFEATGLSGFDANNVQVFLNVSATATR